ncbi:MAG TPA: hypothetical protein VF017_17010 [Thermoanaerobaculia bacterium]|nr:hypothetical protein [Thermoanaerobaculia bacterium]
MMRSPARLSALVLLLSSPILQAQDPAEPPRIEEVTDVTAVDLAVRVKNVVGAVPTSLAPTDVRVTEDGQSVPVSSVARLGATAGAEPWRIVLYFDLPLSSKATAHATALALGEQANRLVQLGSVEVVLADPLPRLHLAATRDANELGNSLAALLLSRPGEDAVAGVRRTALAALAPPKARKGDAAKLPPELAREELAAAAVAEELAIIERGLAGLVTWAAEHAGNGPRALLWVTSGFDLDPASFHRRYAPNAGGEGLAQRLVQQVDDAALTLAGYGWTVAPLSFADPGSAPSTPSVQFEAFREQALETTGVTDAGSVARVPVRVPLGGAKTEEQKEAELPVFDAPTAPLKSLAGEGGGELVDRADGLAALLQGLDESFRVTIQVNRRIDGLLRPIEVRSASAGVKVEGKSWLRSATPEALAEARVRRILAGENEIGELALGARFVSEPVAGKRTVRLTLDLSRRGSKPEVGKGALLRLTLASGREEGQPTFEHRLLKDQDLSAAIWTRDEAVPLPADAEWMIVLVEDLASGMWGARDLEP